MSMKYTPLDSGDDESHNLRLWNITISKYGSKIS